MKLRILAILLLLALLLGGCSPSSSYSAMLYDRLDTDIAVTLYTDAGQGKELLMLCDRHLAQGELLFSRVDEGAELAGLNQNGDEAVTVSQELAALLSRALALAEETGGLFDPTAGILAELYDIKGTRPLPTGEAVTAALAYTGYRKVCVTGNLVSRTPGVVLDLGGIAKGYLAQQLVAALLEAGVPGGVLSLGGNVAVFGKKTDGSDFRIALRSPFEGGGTVGVLSLRGTAYVSTSGAYERYRVDEQGNRYHHIFDMQTGRPSESDLASVTVVATDGARADAWSTALFVAGYEEALCLWQEAGQSFEMVLVRKDGEIYTTPGLSFSPT